MNSNKDISSDDAFLGVSPAGSKKRKLIFWSLILLCLIGLSACYVFFFKDSSGADTFVTAQAEKGNLTVEVSANGTLKPIRTVSLGSELSGIVRKVNADVNDEVKVGEVLIELDDTKLSASLQRARASLQLSKANLTEAQAAYKEASSKLARLLEVRRLSGGKSPSRLEIDSQEALVAKTQASIESARAKIQDAEEAVKSAASDLSKTKILSPIDGVVLARSVEPGYAVAASLQAVELFKLATDLKKLELQVNIDEADVGAVKKGQKATFTVSAYPDRKFAADLQKVAYGSTKTDNVVTYVTYLDANNPNNLLRPGMTATATIETVSLKDALLVPNTALRFRPVEKTKAPSSLPIFAPHPGPAAKKTTTSTHATSGAQKKAVVYVLRDGVPTAIPLIVGFSDGRMTEVIKGELKAGDAVIVDQKRGAK